MLSPRSVRSHWLSFVQLTALPHRFGQRDSSSPVAIVIRRRSRSLPRSFRPYATLSPLQSSNGPKADTPDVSFFPHRSEEPATTHLGYADRGWLETRFSIRRQNRSPVMYCAHRG